MNSNQKDFCAAQPGAQSDALTRMKAIFESAEDYGNTAVWRAFFLSDEFLREQYSETFADSMVQYLTQWQEQKTRKGFFAALAARMIRYLSRWQERRDKKGFFAMLAARMVRRLRQWQKGDAFQECCLPKAFMAELAIAYAFVPQRGRYSVVVPESFPAREIVMAQWNADMENMKYLPLELLEKPGSAVRMRAFSDYLRLKDLSGRDAILPDSKKVWSDILMNGQSRCLEKPDDKAGYLDEEYRGECLIRLYVFWIQTEEVPACVLEYMYREYNLKNIEHSVRRSLYMPLKQEILKQYPAIEQELYGEGTKS